MTAGPPPVIPDGVAPSPSPDVLLTAPPIAGPVPWEWHSPDPPVFARPDGSTIFRPSKRHSDFWSDESGYFQLAVADLGSQLDR